MACWRVEQVIIKAGENIMRAIGIVLAGGNSSRMGKLANKRAVAAMPIAGSYRSIDFDTEQYVELSCTESSLYVHSLMHVR